MKKFEDVEYVELLFNSVEKCIAVRPCERSSINAIKWGTIRDGRWAVLPKSCKGFSEPLYELMGWNKDCKYKLRGQFCGTADEQVMIFELEEPEVLVREKAEEQFAEETEKKPEDAQKPIKKILYPEAWAYNFGESTNRTVFLQRVAYRGNWDILRPARTVEGMEIKTRGVLIMHDTAEYTDEKEIVDQKAIELAEDFSYEGYQVVRRELFAHLREPAVVIRRDSVTFNTACIAGLEDAVYIQILVNQDNKRMVVRKCEENDKDALRWCVAKPDKRKSRKMTNRIFSAMMYEMMGWNLDCRYKILGHKITFEDETIYVFDLMETEIFLDIKGKRVKKDTESQSTTESANNIEETVSSNTDNERSAEEIKRKNRIPFYPKEWKDSFGLPVEEHRKALEVNMLDGYAEFTTGK